MEFTGLTSAWAADVATHLDRFAGSGSPHLDDIWLSPSSALMIRYRVGRRRLATRMPLDRDPTSWEAPSDSGTLASNLLHALHAPDTVEWTDGEGYGWWGDPPEGGWTALHQEDHAVTFR